MKEKLIKVFEFDIKDFENKTFRNNSDVVDHCTKLAGIMMFLLQTEVIDSKQYQKYQLKLESIFDKKYKLFI